MLLFDEIDQTNRAYCKALGLDATPYESPLSAAEIEIADHMTRHGISRKAAESFIALNHMPARQVAMGPRKPQGRCVVEYARSPEQIAESARMHGEALDKYYAACRARTTISPCFVGD